MPRVTPRPAGHLPARCPGPGRPPPGLLGGHVEHVIGGIDPVHPPPLDGGQGAAPDQAHLGRVRLPIEQEVPVWSLWQRAGMRGLPCDLEAAAPARWAGGTRRLPLWSHWSFGTFPSRAWRGSLGLFPDAQGSCVNTRAPVCVQGRGPTSTAAPPAPLPCAWSVRGSPDLTRTRTAREALTPTQVGNWGHTHPHEPQPTHRQGLKDTGALEPSELPGALHVPHPPRLGLVPPVTRQCPTNYEYGSTREPPCTAESGSSPGAGADLTDPGAGCPVRS